MADRNSYIVSAKRSPSGRFLGGLSRLTAAQIGGQVARAAVAEAGAAPDAIDECLIGHVLQAGAGQNPARQVALDAGLPDTISACTVNMVCGSGLQSVMFADQIIRAGDADVLLTGGIESMSQAPFLLGGMRNGHKFGDAQLIDSLKHDGLVNIYDGALMGDIAEYTAEKAGITREMQDAYAVQSHQRAAAADSAGLFSSERVPIEIRRGKAPLEADETVRPEVSTDALSSLKPAFPPGRTVTAGNASSLADGAAMLLIVSDAGLGKVKAKPIVRIVASATSGGPPRELFFAPIKGCRMVCEEAGWPLDSVDLWDINEAFAAQMLAVVQGLELDQAKVNVHGGAIALGHPLGASGARVLTTLVHAMQARKSRRGVASLCLGGGNAVALAVELC